MAGLCWLNDDYMSGSVAEQQQSSERPRKWAKKFTFAVSSLQQGGSMRRSVIIGLVLGLLVIIIFSAMVGGIVSFFDYLWSIVI